MAGNLRATGGQGGFSPMQSPMPSPRLPPQSSPAARPQGAFLPWRLLHVVHRDFCLDYGPCNCWHCLGMVFLMWGFRVVACQSRRQRAAAGAHAAGHGARDADGQPGRAAGAGASWRQRGPRPPSSRRLSSACLAWSGQVCPGPLSMAWDCFGIVFGFVLDPEGHCRVAGWHAVWKA